MGNERRVALRNGGNRVSERMNQFQMIKNDALPNAYKIDNSLFEIDSIQQDFMRKLTGDETAEPQSFEQLLSEINENYKGEERDKRVAALKTAFSFVETQRQQEELIRLETTNQLNDGYSVFRDGVNALLERYEQIHADIMKNYVGDERALRLKALEYAFNTASNNIANTLSFLVMNLGGMRTNEIEAIEDWIATSSNLQNHVNDMLRNAFDFFKSTDSFSGFADTEAANLTGALSFGDIAIILSDSLRTAVDSDLSESGRTFLYDIMNHDFQNEEMTAEQRHANFIAAILGGQTLPDIDMHIMEPIQQPMRYGYNGSPITGRYLDPSLSASTIPHHFRHFYLSLGGELSDALRFSGIEGGFARFEELRQALKDNFEGDELKARLEALEIGFTRATEQLANDIATALMLASSHYVLEEDSVNLSDAQLATNARIRQEANNLIEHIGGMFRAALAFFNATGSFAGFFDTAEANIPGMPSLRDVDLLSRQTAGNVLNTSSTTMLNTLELSNSSRDFLSNFFRIT